jgi:hypothetical protein
LTEEASAIQQAVDNRAVVGWLKDLSVDYAPHVLTDVSTVGLALAGIWLGSDSDNALGWLLVIVSAAVFLFARYKVWRAARRVSALESDNVRLAESLAKARAAQQGDYFASLRGQLSVLANNVLDFDDTERISVYKHDGRAFVMLGRYSKSPIYDRVGRGIYPDDAGCIAAAWQSGTSFVDLPDPASDFEEYVRLLVEDWNFGENEARSLKMRSRSLAAFAVEDAKYDHRIAVIVFESVRAGRLDRAVLRDVMKAEERRLAQFLERMQAQEPTPSFALAEGF